MKVEPRTVPLRPRGLFGRIAMAIANRLPGRWRNRAARLFWRLGLLAPEGQI